MPSIRHLGAATGVLLRHLARDSDHVAALPRLSTPGYAAALAALEAGDLLAAERLALAAGPRGVLLRRWVAGEIALLTAPTAVPGSHPLHLPLRHPLHLRAFRAEWLSRRGVDQPYCTERAGGAVLHLVTNALPEVVAGYTIRTQGIARAQRANGRDAHVVTRLGFPVTRGHIAATALADVDGVPHHRLLPAHLPLRADAALRLDVERTARLVEQLRPAVLHAHSNHVNAQVALALRERFGIPVVYELRGFLEETWLSRQTAPDAASSDRYRLTRGIEGRCLRAADAVVTISEGMRAAVVERGVDPARVHVVPNGVDQRFLEVFAPETAGLTVGVVGTLNAYEGVDVLIRAVAQLRRAGSGVRLRIVGDGPERTALEKLAAHLGIADATTFTGRVPHDRVVAEHRAIDVYAVPRRDLPVTRLVPPLKPVEAMALGRPVVASDLPPLRELVTPDRGVLVPPDDPTALAAAIARLLDAPDVRRRLGADGREWVRRTRTWATAADVNEQIYRRIQGEDA